MSAKSTKIRHIIDKIFCKKIAKEKLKRHRRKQLNNTKHKTKQRKLKESNFVLKIFIIHFFLKS